MTHYMGRELGGIVVTVLLVAVSLLWSITPVHADANTIRVGSFSVTSEFPEGFRIKLEASSENEITSVAVRIRVGQRTQGAYDYLGGPDGADLERGTSVSAELFWRTNTAARYIPPGTLITYSFEVEDSKGTLLETEKRGFIYHDARFEWQEISEGAVTVAYHGPVKTRAQSILDTIVETLAVMGPLLGGESDDPIRVTMYNNVKEMLEAYPPRSAAISRELITQGQAWADDGTLLVLGGDRLAKGTASHEVTHIVVHRAGDSIFRSVPPWLNEGLAEYGNVDPGFEFDIALEFAQSTGRLLPVMFMKNMPGNPEDVIIFYGQSRNIVRFMIEDLGAEKMKQLMAALKSGKDMDDALEKAYGVDRLGLDNMWRDSIGAPRYVPSETGSARPTPIPQRAVGLYSLTPQPDTETVAAKSDEPLPLPWRPPSKTSGPRSRPSQQGSLSPPPLTTPAAAVCRYTAGLARST